MLSFQAVYSQYVGFVRASGRRLGADSNALDDVVQDVFMVIHTRLHTLRHPQALPSWIYCVVRHTVNNHLRSMRGQHSTSIGLDGSELASMEPTPCDVVVINDELALVAEALAKLDQRKREIFAMVEFDEMTVPQAAASLRIPRNTAYTRLRRARREFDAALVRVTRTGAALHAAGQRANGAR
jgi:RNA polymerase sigma-70 factor (ECF subfamily)